MAQMRNPAGQGGASGGDAHAAKLNSPDHTRATAAHQVLYGFLIGSTTCSVAGITVHGHAPVLAQCRRLIEAGHNPAGRPRFRPYRPWPSEGSPPIAPNDRAATPYSGGGGMSAARETFELRPEN